MFYEMTVSCLSFVYKMILIVPKYKGLPFASFLLQGYVVASSSIITVCSSLMHQVHPPDFVFKFSHIWISKVLVFYPFCLFTREEQAILKHKCRVILVLNVDELTKLRIDFNRQIRRNDYQAPQGLRFPITSNRPNLGLSHKPYTVL